MPREKKEPDPPPGVPAWMATFSDLVTLLLTFFVMLMAMASFDDTARVNSLLRSLHEKLGADGFDPTLMGPGEGEFMSPTRSADVAVSPLIASLAAAFREHLSNVPVTADATADELRLDFPDSAFFKPGSAEVHPNGYATLSQVAELLATEDTVSVDVLGHARIGEAPDARELAADRAVAVVERLRRGVPGERITVGAFGPDAVDPISDSQALEQRIALVVRTEDLRGRAAMQGLSEPEESDAGRR